MKPMLTAAAAAIAVSTGAAGAQTDEQASEPQAQSRAELFAAIDTDSDGAVTRSEFVSYAQERKGMSEAEAGREFDELLKADQQVSKEAFLRSEHLREWTRAGEAAGMSDQSSRVAVFRAADENDDDKITRQEFAAFARDEANMPKSQADRLFDELSDDSETMSRMEFLAADDRVQPIVQAYDATGDERAAAGANPHFEALDENNDDVVSKSEFASFIADADNVSRREATRLFDAAAGDDREMTLVEFVSGDDRLQRIAENIAGERGPLLKSAQTSTPEAQGQARAPAAAQDQADARTARQATAGASDAARPNTFDEIDRNNDGEVRKSEFVEMARQKAEEEFDRIAGQDGALSRDELTDAEFSVRTSRLEE